MTFSQMTPPACKHPRNGQQRTLVRNDIGSSCNLYSRNNPWNSHTSARTTRTSRAHSVSHPLDRGTITVNDDARRRKELGWKDIAVRQAAERAKNATPWRQVGDKGSPRENDERRSRLTSKAWKRETGFARGQGLRGPKRADERSTKLLNETKPMSDLSGQSELRRHMKMRARRGVESQTSFETLTHLQSSSELVSLNPSRSTTVSASWSQHVARTAQPDAHEEFFKDVHDFFKLSEG